MESKKFEIYYIEYPANECFLREKFSKVKLDRSNYELLCREGELEGEFTPLDNIESNKRIINKPELHAYAIKARRNFFKGNKIDVIEKGRFLIQRDKFQIISPCTIEVSVQKDPDLENIIHVNSEIQRDIQVLSSNFKLLNKKFDESIAKNEVVENEDDKSINNAQDNIFNKIEEIDDSIRILSHSLKKTKSNSVDPKSIIIDFLSFLKRKT